MKKMLMFAALAAMLSLAGCKKTPQSAFAPRLDLSKAVDATRWLDNLDDAKIAAHQSGKDIILLFSADDQDHFSRMLKDSLLDSEAFIADITRDYVLVNLDFSSGLYEQSAEDEAIAAALEANMKLATVYGIEITPSFFLLSKEGYPITPLFYDDTLRTAEEFRDEIAQEGEAIAAFRAVYERIGTGSNEDKVRAIDDLYGLADPRQTYLLAPLAEQVLALDPTNKTGLLGKYALALADAQATDAALDNDPERMTEAFAAAAENKYLTPDERQQAYYYAGYFLAGVGDPDYEQIKGYLQKSIDAAPDSEQAPQIARLLQMIDVHAEGLLGEEADAPVPAEAGDGADVSTFTVE